jgi:hypothetical protein
MRFYGVFSCRAALLQPRFSPAGCSYALVCFGGEFQKFAAYRRPQTAGLSFNDGPLNKKFRLKIFSRNINAFYKFTPYIRWRFL